VTCCAPKKARSTWSKSTASTPSRHRKTKQPTPTEPTLAPEAEALLAAPPGEFVRARAALARRLREEGRRSDADAVATLRKPPPVVLAVNRAARDRPQAARDAADAAGRLAGAQVAGTDRASYEDAARDLDRALDLLVEVAIACLGRGTQPATQAMQQRARKLVRAAMADERSRGQLVRGALTAEVETTGFGAFAGVPVPRTRRAPTSRASRGSHGSAERRAHERALQGELAEKRRELRTAEGAVRAAEHERDRLVRAVAELEAKLER
jgi:hypothetical protein